MRPDAIWKTYFQCIHVVLNNGAHESVGGQPSAGHRIDFTKIAEACGYATVGKPVESEQKLIDAIEKLKICGKGGVIFHTAVSPAGVGPTSSNKLEIESSMEPLSKAGIKLHLGKGAIKADTVKALDENNAVFAVIPPVTALLGAQTTEQECIAFPELGMEALYRLNVEKYPAVIGAAHGVGIYDK